MRSLFLIYCPLDRPRPADIDLCKSVKLCHFGISSTGQPKHQTSVYCQKALCRMLALLKRGFISKHDWHVPVEQGCSFASPPSNLHNLLYCIELTTIHADVQC